MVCIHPDNEAFVRDDRAVMAAAGMMGRQEEPLDGGVDEVGVGHDARDRGRLQTSPPPCKILGAAP